MMYDLTIPALVRGLTILDDYMDKAAADAAQRGIDPAVLINARLAPDMLPLSAQVQRLSDNAKGGVARLTGVAPPSFSDDEVGFDDLKARIAKTVAFLESVEPVAFEGAADRVIELKFRAVAATMSGYDYLTKFLLPNVYFHIATAHGILRNQGVGIGKKDYLGSFD